MVSQELSPTRPATSASSRDSVNAATSGPVDVKPWSNPALSKKDEPVAPSSATWNTRNLGLRLGVDILSAASAGVLVAPIITMIDRGIIENASGRDALGVSLRKSLRTFVFTPHRFIFSKPFGLIFALYTGTYTTANALDTATSTISAKPAHTVSSGPSKFVATSAANMSLCLYKDSRFTQMFGDPSQAPRRVPAPTFVLFALRDCLTIFASFNLPPILAPRLSDALGKSLERHISGASAAQFIAPAAVQLFSTPLHLLGLDLYNRNGVGIQDRFRKVASEWGKSCLARMGRIIPAFGVGGVVNMQTRKTLMTKLE